MTHDSELVERFETSDIAKLAIRGEVPPSSSAGKWVRFSDYESLRARLAEVEGERDEKISRALAKADFESERAGDIENENDALRVEASKHAHDAETVRRERDAAEATVRELREGLATQRAATLREAAAFARKAGDTWSGSRDAMQCVQEAAVDAKCEEIATALEALAGGDA